MLPQEPVERKGYDIFVSYAHALDHRADIEKVSALVRAIGAQYQRETGNPLRVFHNTGVLGSMDEWETTVLPGLRQSRLMIAVLSPAYFASPFCRREWELYVETELAMALPGEGIIPIYAERYPPFEADPVEPESQAWIKDLRAAGASTGWPSGPIYRSYSTRRSRGGPWPACPGRFPSGCIEPPRVPPHPARCLHPALASSVVTPSCI